MNLKLINSQLLIEYTKINKDIDDMNNAIN